MWLGALCCDSGVVRNCIFSMFLSIARLKSLLGVQSIYLDGVVIEWYRLEVLGSGFL